MPLSADNFVQENSGGVSVGASSVAVTLPAGTTAGNTLIAVINTGGVLGALTLPSGWVQDPPSFAHNSTEGFLFARKPPSAVTAGETSWTFTGSGTLAWAWYVAEVSNLDPAGPVDASASADSSASITASTTVTRSTGTTGSNPGLSTVAIAAHGCCSGGSGVPVGTFAGHTNGFGEVAESGSTASASVVNKGLSVSHLFSASTTGPFECTATYTADSGGVSQHAFGGMVVYRAADSPVVSPLTWFYGFGNGTHNGLGSSIIGSSPLLSAIIGTVGTDLIVQTGSARSGSGAYGCRIVQAGAAKYLACGTAQFGTGQGTVVAGWPLRVQSSTGVTILAEFAPAVGTIAQVVYDPAASKVGVRWGSGGTVSYQSGTTIAGTDYPWVSLRVSGLTGTAWHLDWSIEESGVLTAQTSPADLTGQTASSLAQIRWGGNAAQTVTQDVTDLCLSSFYGAYPLPPHRTTILKVDPAGTPAVTGTVGNFALVTSNATGAALTSGTLTSARDAIDELPPTISASADGIVQTITAASDYIEFPMQTYTASATEVIVAVRLLACLISTTGAGAGSLGVRGWDGTAEAVLMPTSFTSTPGSGTTPSGTVPPWVGYMWNPPNGWTQAKLDAAALRFGFSTDATPDMGVHAMYLEVAVGPTRNQPLFGGTTAAEINPNNAGVVSATVTAPADLGATLRWTDPGGSGSQAVAAAGTFIKQFDPADATTVSRLEVESDPEAADRP